MKRIFLLLTIALLAAAQPILADKLGEYVLNVGEFTKIIPAESGTLR